MDIGTEISAKLRLAVKRKIAALEIEYDEDLCDFILLLFAQKKRFPTIVEDLKDLLENKTEEFAAWLDELISKGLFAYFLFR